VTDFNFSTDRESHWQGVNISNKEEQRMKVIISLAMAAFFLAVGAHYAPAQDAGGSGKGAPESFQDRKARILKMIDERRARLDQAKACVEAATNDDEMRKCRPERPEGMGPGGMMRRGGPGNQNRDPGSGPAQ
jgi:hypothetical protein